jgi:hypothetical protein
VAPLFGRRWAESKYTRWLLIGEEQASVNAEALAIAMGIPFYVVCDPEGDFQAVQTPSDDHQVVATFDPPRAIVVQHSAYRS